MNFIKLFLLQAQLDEHIKSEKSLQGQNLLSKKITALYTELGELTNELPEIFKFWSNKKNDYEKALKEYVDVLHFLLSIGLEMGMTHENWAISCDYTEDSVERTINKLYGCVAELDEKIQYGSHEDKVFIYEMTFNLFVGLGEKHLGFKMPEVEAAYYKKNRINHNRQQTGY